MAPGVLASISKEQGPHEGSAPSVFASKSAVKTAEPQDVHISLEEDRAVHPMVLKTFRILVADLCQQFKGGHPG